MSDDQGRRKRVKTQAQETTEITEEKTEAAELTHGTTEAEAKTENAKATHGALPSLPKPVPHFEERYLDCTLPPQPEFEGPAAAASATAISQFEREGFIVVRKMLRPEAVKKSIDRMQEIADNWHAGIRPGRNDPNEAPITPLVDVDLAFETGALPMPKENIDTIRRFFRLAVHDDHFRNLTTCSDLLYPLQEMWGPDIILLQSMGLLKPPGTGEKRWHADQGYFRLQPSKVAAYWIALDECDTKNGCMFVSPRTHLHGTPKHSVPNKGIDGRSMETHPKGHIFYSASQKPNSDDAFAIPMQPGDALIFDGNLLHYTPPNNTQRRRRALQFHYASASCQPTSCQQGHSLGEEIASPNPTFGPSAAGFDCAPSGGTCTEPQYWYYRQGELVASGKRKDGCI